MSEQREKVWRVGSTVITSEMADEVHHRANDEWSIEALEAMLIREYGVSEEDADRVVQAVLDLNG